MIIKIWNWIEYKHLQLLVLLLFLSMPFERIPSILTPIGPVRLNMFLTVTISCLLVILIIKKDEELAKIKLNLESKILLIFIGLSNLSFYRVENYNRFVSAYSATLICIFGAIFVGNFLDKPFEAFVSQLKIWIFILFFGLYQYLGDMSGLPTNLTGMKDLFQKHVFGTTRVIATFNEPSYLANALFLIIFAFLFLSFSNIKIFDKSRFRILRYLTHDYYRLTCLALVSLALVLFILTIAKSAWVILPVVLIFAGIAIVHKNLAKNILPYLLPFCLIILIGFSYLLLSNNPVVGGVVASVIETFEGNSATAFERKTYLDSANYYIPDNILLGVGSGQFGTVASQLIINELTPYQSLFFNAPQSLDNTEKIIVFNVYSEVILEYGLIASIVLFGLFAFVLIKNFVLFFETCTIGLLDKINLMRLTFGLYFIASLCQWYFISPIYVNPIWIGFGFLILLNNYKKENIAV